jgi:hypothetical protein
VEFVRVDETIAMTYLRTLDALRTLPEARKPLKFVKQMRKIQNFPRTK